MSFGQNVNIPDPNFKASLLSNPNINTNGDTEIQVSEASSYDDILGCFSCQISDLTGVEYFENVTNMQFDQNLLTSADFSGCAALESLSLYSNNLTSINISQNQRLKSLDVMSNDLTAINLTNNDSLVLLNLITNNIESLDLSQNGFLEVLYCFNNNLTSLDVSQNNNLIFLNVSSNPISCLNVRNGNNMNFDNLNQNYEFGAINCPNLFCIQVDDAEWSTVNWTFIDPQTSFSEDCNNDCTSSLTELTSSKTLIQILDLMGHETSFKPNIPLIYVYDDGTSEKVFTIED